MFRTIIKEHQQGRHIDVERIVDVLMDSVPQHSEERTFEERSFNSTQQKIELLTAAEKEVFIECASEMADLLKQSINQEMN